MSGVSGGSPGDTYSWSSDGSRRATRSLLLTLADNKRLLGIRYSDCMLGSPSLETGIAAASMAQDEWGHSRLTYALLTDFGDDAKQIEHERPGAEYASMEALDAPFGSFPAMVAAALTLDFALTAQYEALAESSYSPVRNRVHKLLEEEVLHQQFALGWAHRLSESPLRDDLSAHLADWLPGVLRWFGPGDDPDARTLLADGIVRAGPDELRTRLLTRLASTLGVTGLLQGSGITEGESGWAYGGSLEWREWDGSRRRGSPGGPDEDTLARVRGDRNRALLVD